jgi:hypothetical protein
MENGKSYIILSYGRPPRDGAPPEDRPPLAPWDDPPGDRPAPLAPWDDPPEDRPPLTPDEDELDGRAPRVSGVE